MLHETSQENIAVLEDPGPTWFGRPPIRYDLVVEIQRVLLVSIVRGVLEETIGLSRVDHDDTRHLVVAPSRPNNATTHSFVHRLHVNAHL